MSKLFEAGESLPVHCSFTVLSPVPSQRGNVYSGQAPDLMELKLWCRKKEWQTHYKTHVARQSFALHWLPYGPSDPNAAPQSPRDSRTWLRVIQGIQRYSWGVGLLHTPSWQQQGPRLRGGYLGSMRTHISRTEINKTRLTYEK